MKTEKCVCGKVIPYFRGYAESQVLIISDFPDKISPEQSFSDIAGKIFRQELALQNLDLLSMRYGYFTPHKCLMKDKECLQYGIDRCLKELENKEAVLLLGSACVKHFTGKSSGDYNGLLADSLYWSMPTMIGTNPSIAIAGTIGEVRFMAKRFKLLLKKLGLDNE